MGFLPRLNRPRRKSSGTTSPMYHMPFGAVHVYEGEDVIVVTKHKEQKQELTANHGRTFRWITSS